MLLRVQVLGSNRVELERPLPWKVEGQFRPEVHAYKPTVQGAGIEKLTIRFPFTKWVHRSIRLGWRLQTCGTPEGGGVRCHCALAGACRYAGHLKEAGYNAIMFNQLAHRCTRYSLGRVDRRGARCTADGHGWGCA
jgi:hypothetical protein